MKKGMAFGSFRVLHPGHLHYLQKAKQKCDKLVVVVATDKNIRKTKGEPIIPEGQRLELIKALKPVDKAIIGSNTDMYQPVKEENPDILVLGPDQEVSEEKIRKELEKRDLDPAIIRLDKRTSEELHETSKIIKKITNRF